MSELMASVLRQSLGIADPCMHAVARLPGLRGGDGGAWSAHGGGGRSDEPSGAPPRPSVLLSTIDSAISLPKATCRGPSILAGRSG
eukprot:351139-Chlamydomonas_euryale.AAC.3